MSDSSSQRDIEFHRRVDGLTYRYLVCEPHGGLPAWKREDRDIWIAWREGHGWVTANAAGDILGVPWAIPLHAQGPEPPSGIWVSRKGDKAYVYALVYV